MLFCKCNSFLLLLVVVCLTVSTNWRRESHQTPTFLHSCTRDPGHPPSRRPARRGAAGSTGPAGACGRARPGGGADGWSATCPVAGWPAGPGPGCRRYTLHHRCCCHWCCHCRRCCRSGWRRTRCSGCVGATLRRDVNVKMKAVFYGKSFWVFLFKTFIDVGIFVYKDWEALRNVLNSILT